MAHQERLVLIGRCAAGIAHDVGNLLATIQAGIAALAERPELDAAARADIAEIGAVARRGSGLVRHLLACGRMLPSEPRRIELREAVADLASLLRHVMGPGIRLEVDAGDSDLPVRIDPTRFDQVLVNLAANARTAMPDGGSFRVRCRQENTTGAAVAVIEVQDTGIGIAPEILPRIFEPFFTTSRDRGTGLGLATVQEVVREAGGSIAVESRLGFGTCMRLCLPLCAAPAGGGGTILLVEDEALLRRLMEGALKTAGWTVLAADSAETALPLADAHPGLAAVVTDLELPGQDGGSLVLAIRERLARPDLPALIASGYADAAMGGLALPQATAYLSKPYTVPELLETLRRLVRPPEEPAGDSRGDRQMARKPARAGHP
ncbi:Histidine kinase [Rhodovastum atsumiense]|nr:Histidine kinase [Rhodovastum atsumiense]